MAPWRRVDEPPFRMGNQVTGQPSSDKVGTLSLREFQIAEAIWGESPDKITCDTLGIAISTLRTYLTRIFLKLSVCSRPGVVRQFERYRLSPKSLTQSSRHDGSRRREVNFDHANIW